MTEPIPQTMPPTMLPKATMTTIEHNRYIAQLNPDKILAENAGKIQAAMMENDANERAMKEPLPGITEYMFDEDEKLVTTSKGIIKVRKWVASDIKIFKQTKSPFYQLMMGDVNEDFIKSIITDEDMMFNLIFQFITPVVTVRNLLKNKEQYDEQVMLKVGDVFAPQDLAILLHAIISHAGIVEKAKINIKGIQSTEDDKKKQSVIEPVVSVG